MKASELEAKVSELVCEFGGTASCDRRKLALLAKKNGEEREERNAELLDALDYLRICIKYQAFDLEATRRENKYLKQIIEERCD